MGTNHSTIDTNNSYQNQINNCVDNNVFNQSVGEIFNSIPASELDRIFEELDGIPETVIDHLLADPISLVMNDVLSDLQNSSTNSVSVTQNCVLNTNSTQLSASNDSNSDHNFVDQNSMDCENSSKANKSLNESIVSIDLNALSDASDSPKSLNESIGCCKQLAVNERPIPSTSQTDSVPITSFKSKDTDQRSMERTPQILTSLEGSQQLLYNGISNQSTEQNPKRSPLKIRSMGKYSYNYCAKDFRIFNLTRHSARHKASTQNDEFDYENDLLVNASWDQIDGSSYEAKVVKWNEEDMDEDRRKDILRTVEQKKFVKSVYDLDVNVYYCWNAFEGQSIQNKITGSVLKCLMRLDSNGLKRQRFVKYKTRLFLLSGQSLVTTENGKQKRNVEVGHEVIIPPHTRFEVENRGVESTYFYVLVSNF